MRYQSSGLSRDLSRTTVHPKAEKSPCSPAGELAESCVACTSRTAQSRLPDVVVLLAPAERGDSAAVAEDLARRFAEHFERGQWDVLGLIGGDGARETLARLGASGIRIVDSLLEGIPLGLVVGGQADGMPVFTKAGGFGAEDALVRCVERMKA